MLPNSGTPEFGGGEVDLRARQREASRVRGAGIGRPSALSPSIWKRIASRISASAACTVSPVATQQFVRNWGQTGLVIDRLDPALLTRFGHVGPRWDTYARN
jgi:hypothetical protein